MRRTEVQVEQLEPERNERANSFEAYDADFRKNFTSTYGSRGTKDTYETYTPAYRYGYDLVSDKRYSGKEWNAFESAVKHEWETRNPGQSAWEDVKEAVYHAWDTVRGQTRRKAA